MCSADVIHHCYWLWGPYGPSVLSTKSSWLLLLPLWLCDDVAGGCSALLFLTEPDAVCWRKNGPMVSLTRAVYGTFSQCVLLYPFLCLLLFYSPPPSGPSLSFSLFPLSLQSERAVEAVLVLLNSPPVRAYPPTLKNADAVFFSYLLCLSLNISLLLSISLILTLPLSLPSLLSLFVSQSPSLYLSYPLSHPHSPSSPPPSLSPPSSSHLPFLYLSHPHSPSIPPPSSPSLSFSLCPSTPPSLPLSIAEYEGCGLWPTQLSPRLAAQRWMATELLTGR